MDDTALIVLAVLAAVALVVGALALRRRSNGEPAAEAEGPPKARSQLGAGLRRVWETGLDSSVWERLEETLLAADVGVGPSTRIVDRVRAASPGSVSEARSQLATALRDQFLETDRSIRLEGKPSVVLVVGVNGSGKTTTIAKLAHAMKSQGKMVVLGAADTFRAAAGEQLDTWADRVGVSVVMGQQGGDPASVAFDAIASARAKGADVVIIDTAGRLHGKKNLMAELAKIHRVASGEEQVAEVLLVLDATSGQNALAQVEQFAEAVPLTGIVLAKIDGTARGGIVVTVEDTLGVPVKYLGVGEGLDDLEPFDPDRFVQSLLEE